MFAPVALKKKRGANTSSSSSSSTSSRFRSHSFSSEEDKQREKAKTASRKKEEAIIPLIDGWGKSKDAKVDKNVPLLIRNRVPGLEEIRNEKERLRKDVEMRPDEPDFENASINLEDFGPAMLRGMGHKSGGKEVNASLPEVRPALLGLGAVPKPDWKKKDDGERVNKKKAKHSSWLCDGAVVKMTSGKYKGEFAVIKQSDGVPGLNNIIIQLDPGSDASVLDRLPEAMVKRDDLELVNHVDLPKLHPGKVLLQRVEDEKHRLEEEARKLDKSLAASQSRKRKLDQDDAPDMTNIENTKRTKDTLSSKKKKKKKMKDLKRSSCWLMSGIRVRVVSKSLASGEYYSEKAIIEDVLDPIKCMCTISVGEGKTRRIIENVSQKQLDTALPKRGGTVIIVQGDLKGEKGQLLERDKRKEKAMVQLRNDLSVQKLRFEEIAEYCLHD